LADDIFGVDDAIIGGIECYWWKFWRRLRALTEQLPRPVALAGAFEVPTGGTALTVVHQKDSSHSSGPPKTFRPFTGSVGKMPPSIFLRRQSAGSDKKTKLKYTWQYPTVPIVLGTD
jgi:hypothetical protein